MGDGRGTRLEAGRMSLVATGRVPCTSAAFAQLSAEILRGGNGLRFRARGTSMSPLVRDGDVVLVRPVDARSVHLGDVILCRREPERVVVHRVVGVTPGCDGPLLTVQGDQVARPDGVVLAAEVYGRVAAIERDGAHIDLDGPMMRVLGVLAALRSRWGFGRGHHSQFARQLVKRLPVFSRYLG